MYRWIVTIERISNGKRKKVMLTAANSDDAGRLACDLIGGPGTTNYLIISCVSVDRI